jgi:hypothetical protein
MYDIITEARIARALKSGPPAIRDGAKVIDMDAAAACRAPRGPRLDVHAWRRIASRHVRREMGLRWIMDAWAEKPKPTNITGTDLHAQRCRTT